MVSGCLPRLLSPPRYSSHFCCQGSRVAHCPSFRSGGEAQASFHIPTVLPETMPLLAISCSE